MVQALRSMGEGDDVGAVHRKISTTRSSAAAATTTPRQLICWDSTFTDTLPEDPNRTVTARTRPRQVDAVFSLGTTRRSSDPRVVAVCRDMVDRLGLAGLFDGTAEMQLAQWLCGNEKLPGADHGPWCSNYGGHQFGSW